MMSIDKLTIHAVQYLVKFPIFIYHRFQIFAILMVYALSAKSKGKMSGFTQFLHSFL